MRLRRSTSMWIVPLLLLGALFVVASCAPAQVGPRAWIDWPRDGHRIARGTTLSLICHAYADQGVAEVRLEVDRQPYRVASPDGPGEQFVEASIDWFADEPGTYLLSVVAFDVNGQASNPADVTVRVTGEVAETPLPLPEETAPPLAPTPEEPVSTMVLTETLPAPTATFPPPTATTVPPTATPPPPPPRIVSFEVTRSQVSAGECVTFSWVVEGSPAAIYFDGQGVTSPASSNVCPTGTSDYQLRAEGPGGVDTESRTVVVVAAPSPTPDTQGPAAPSLVSPTGGLLPCHDVTLDWNPVTDPSGIETYVVKVEKDVSGNWQSAWGGTTTDTEVTVSLGCGLSYRWEVRAQDGAGNWGPWSSWGEFGVELP